MNKSIVRGSLSDIAQQENKSLAESFLGADCVVIVDNSGSMGAEDGTGKSRRERAQTQLKYLQETFAGKIALICFADRIQFLPGGKMDYVGEGTNLVSALNFAKVADGLGIKLVLISDGLPNDPGGALAVARKYETPIECIYIGSENGTGQHFLQDLALATGGAFSNSAETANIQDEIEILLLGG
jgi:hypothetical protein